MTDSPTTTATSAASPSPSNGPVVRTEQGLVQGVEENGVFAFKGLRYAAPPTGRLRWRPPHPPTAWQGIRQADSFGPVCPQRWLPFGPPGWRQEPADEDCLSLNIWTAAVSADEKRPVMLWIHGGAFEIGSGSTPAYHGDVLAKKGVVVVTINYRLGVLGFLAHPELTAESRYSASGNYGLMDMIAALRWVHANIAAFGGDPHNITIFGESAGGGAVMLLTVSPLAKGLFQRAISESGAALPPQARGYKRPDSAITLAEAEEAGERYMRTIGCSSVDGLRECPTKEIQEAIMSGTGWPIADGHVVPGQVTTLYRAGRQHDVPVLLGWNDNEGGLFAQPTTKADVEAKIRREWGPAAETMFRLYPVADDASAGAVNGTTTADIGFAWPAWSLAEAQTKTGTAPAFLYHFTHVPPRTGDSWYKDLPGAQHAEELAFVFGKGPDIWTEAEHRVADAMQNYWINFARSGDPNGPGVPKWAPYRGDTTVQWFVDGGVRAGDVPRLDVLRQIDGIVGT